MIIFCWLMEVWDTLRLGVPVSGHLFGKDEEIHDNVTVVISKCWRCGKTEIVWHK